MHEAKPHERLGNNDLAILISILICKNWSGNINVHLVDNESVKNEDLIAFKEMVRFPKGTEIRLSSGTIIENVPSEKNPDLNIVSISKDLSIEDMIKIVNTSRTSGVFCNDSGFENAIV